MTRALSFLLAAFLAGPGCASSELMLGMDAGSGDFDGDDTYEDVQSIRVDVFPPGGADALPQSVVYGGEDWTGLSVNLAETISWSGDVTAFVANPYDITVPGSASLPVEARVEALVIGERAGASTTTTLLGGFEMQIPGQDGYRVSIVPLADGPLPFLVLEDQAFLQDQEGQSIELGVGIPVHGMVLQSDGSRLPTAAVARLEHAATGVQGPSVEVDATGHFLLRAAPGEYRVIVDGPTESSYLPRVAAQVEVAEDAAEVAVDIDAGLVDSVRCDGRVVTAGGRSLRDLEVRFSSSSLDAAAGTSEVQALVGSDGVFSARLVPGVWTMEALPAYDEAGGPSPVRIDDITVGPDGLDLGSIELPTRVSVSGVVSGYATDGPVPDVLVTAREIGFSGHTWSTRTDAAGRYTLSVPDVPLDFTFTPVDPRETTTWVTAEDPRSVGDLRLAPGQPVEGLVLMDAEPVAYALVEVRDGNTGALYGTTYTDGEGGFALRIDHQGSIGDVSQPGVDTGAPDTGGPDSGAP